MDRHKAHLVVGTCGIVVRQKRGTRQKVFGPSLLAAGSLPLGNRLLQLCEIIEPLLTSLSSQPHFVTRSFEHLG